MLEQGFSYTTSDGAKPGVTILRLEGPFTIGNIFQIQSELRGLKPPCLIVDLGGVPYMDSAGLGVIMNAFVSAQTGGRRVLVANANERIHTLLEITRVDRVLDVCGSVAEAEARA